MSIETMRKRIDSLQSIFLPGKKDALGEYTQEQQDKARSLVLLTHAEIESYLENLSKNAGKKAVKSIEEESYDTFSSRFLSLGAMCYSSSVGEQGHSSLLAIGKAIAGQHEKTVKTNNGIKQASLKALFKIFLFKDELSGYSELTSSLDSLGSLRGEYAHSSHIGIAKTIDPFECKNQIDIALEKLSEFSDDFERLVETGSLAQEISTATDTWPAQT